MTKNKNRVTPAKYEFRVWDPKRKVSRQLATMAEFDYGERLHDCYLLVADKSYNAKIRRNRIKIKRLVGEQAGFQCWSSKWLSSPNDAPKPFGRLLSELHSLRPVPDDFERELTRILRGLRLEKGVRPVFVTKRRRRFYLGSMKAETAEIKVRGHKSSRSTVAIEGSDLNDLIHLRSGLGLTKVPNLAFHLAISRQPKRS